MIATAEVGLRHCRAANRVGLMYLPGVLPASDSLNFKLNNFK
jgi:hypothetical protein